MPDLFPWTKATRKKLHGTRTLHPLDPKDAVPTLDEAWKALSALTMPEVKDAPDAVQAMMATHGGPIPTSLDVVGEMARAHLLYVGADVPKWKTWSAARALVALWAEVGGFRFVVDVLTAKRPYDKTETVYRVHLDGDTAEKRIVTFLPRTPQPKVLDGPWSDAGELESLWWSLRYRVAAIDDATFAEAKASVADLLAGVPEGSSAEGHWFQRSALAFALSRDRDLVAEQIDRLVDAYPGDLVWEGADLLIAAAPDLAHATAMPLYVALGAYSFDVIDSLGTDARPVIQAHFDERRKTASLQYLTQETAALRVLDKA